MTNGVLYGVRLGTLGRSVVTSRGLTVEVLS